MWLAIADMEGYESFHTTRDSRKSGGVSIYYRNGLMMELVHDLCMCNVSIESCAVKVSIGGANYNIMAIYRPHSGTIEELINILQGCFDRDPL